MTIEYIHKNVVLHHPNMFDISMNREDGYEYDTDAQSIDGVNWEIERLIEEECHSQSALFEIRGWYEEGQAEGSERVFVCEVYYEPSKPDNCELKIIVNTPYPEKPPVIFDPLNPDHRFLAHMKKVREV